MQSWLDTMVLAVVHAHREADLPQQNLLDDHSALQQLFVQLLLDLHVMCQRSHVAQADQRKVDGIERLYNAAD